MPNHIRNVWKFRNLTPEKVAYIVNKIATQYDRPGMGKDFIIDFDLIIPEPKFIQDCPKAFRTTSRSHIEESEGRPWFNWYDWHCIKWGTKWNAYDGYIKRGKTWVMFVFSTAWSFPIPVANKVIHLFKECNIEFRFADEDIGSNCGKITYDPVTEEATELFEKDLTDPDRFARDLWKKY